MTNSNDTHPEARGDEVLLANIVPERILYNFDGSKGLEDWDSTADWKTRRLGLVAYNRDGQILTTRRPVFIQYSEFAEFRRKFGWKPGQE